MNDKAHHLHLSIAEAGKLLALKGDHKGALQHYREALRLAVSSSAPEVFFRHYTQCVLESLELTEAYDEIIEFCRNADEHYASLGLSSSLHRRDHGSVLERLGLVQLKKGDIEAGCESLEQARKIAGEGVLPISEEIGSWLKRGYRVDASRILESQRKHHYFVVRRDQVNPDLARSLGQVKGTAFPDPAGTLTG